MEIICNTADNGKKLGDILKSKGVSRRLISSLKRTENGMTRNGRLIRTIDRVSEGDKIILNEGEGNPLEENPDLKVCVLYEDNDLVVFNKPPLMPCHPSVKHQWDTLGNFFAAYCKGLTFRCINRLDRDTSGCVIVAKNQFAANALQQSYNKKYYGIIKNPSLCGGRIFAPIARQEESIILRCIRADGQQAATDYHVIRRNGEYSLVEFLLETGRTHQIRCHMAYKGAALLGDSMYGGDCSLMKRQALHCKEISFIQPTSCETITVKAPLPEDFIRIMYTD